MLKLACDHTRDQKELYKHSRRRSQPFHLSFPSNFRTLPYGGTTHSCYPTVKPHHLGWILVLSPLSICHSRVWIPFCVRAGSQAGGQSMSVRWNDTECGEFRFDSGNVHFMEEIYARVCVRCIIVLLNSAYSVVGQLPDTSIINMATPGQFPPPQCPICHTSYHISPSTPLVTSPGITLATKTSTKSKSIVRGAVKKSGRPITLQSPHCPLLILSDVIQMIP